LGSGRIWCDHVRDSIEMTESTKSDAKMAGLLREELEALQRQRDQYALAMDTATDPKVAIRLQRTLERIEDEIEGLEESLQALPEPDPSGAKPATPPPPSPAPSSAGPTIEPTDWDDEPSTAIYDPDEIRDQLAALDTNPSEPIDFASMEPVTAKSDPKSDPEDADTTQPRAVIPPEPEPEPEPESEPEPEPTTDEPIAGVSPPESPSAGIAPAAIVPPSATVSGGSHPAEPEVADEPAPEVRAKGPEEPSNPLGPVWMDGLSPPTGKVPAAEVPPEPAASPDVLGDDPFAMPSRPAGADTDASSPFGTAVGSPVAGDFGNPISVLDDDLESNSWGTGTKVGLMLVVALFLAGAFYVMSIG